MSAFDSFRQLALRFADPVQPDYEVIRGIMLADILHAAAYELS